MTTAWAHELFRAKKMFALYVKNEFLLVNYTNQLSQLVPHHLAGTVTL